MERRVFSMATENGGIWSKKSDGTYEYKVEGTLVATLKNLEDSNVIINETTGEIVSRTKVDENEVAIPLVEVNGTTITLKRDALTSTTELVNSTGSSYELALDDDCEATDSTKWVEGGTGFILRSITTDSYELAEGNLKVTYASAVDGENIATIKGFSATVKDGTITGVEVDVTKETITITDDAVLGDSDVTITQEANYKFVLDGDFASKITDTWTYSNNTANFKSEVSNGYAVTDGGTKISTTTGGTYTAKITGLDTETVTDNDGKVTGITGITVEDNVISVASSAIKAGSSVALTSNYYTIKLSDETEVTPEWSVSKGTATFDKNYKTGNLATKADGKAITYYTKDTAVTVAKITGLKTDLTNDTIGGVVEAKDDGTIAVSREAFATDKSIALTSDAYTKLVPMDGGNWDVVVSDPAMTVASGKVTVKTDYSAGWAYKTTTNSKTKVTTTDYKNLVLTKAVTTTDATVSGLPSKIGKASIDYKVGTTDDDKNALYVGTTKVLEFTAPIEANEETGTAAAAGKITLYPGAFSNSPSSLKLDAKNNYNFEFATGVDKNGEAIDETEEWSPAPKTVGAHWKTDGKGKALIVSGTTAGYDFATNKDNTPNYKTVNAIKESYTTAATISGLPSYSSTNSSGVPAGDYYDGSSDVIDEGSSILAGLTITSEPTDTAKGVITISNTDLLSLLLKTDGTSSGKKVSLAKNDNYEFKFATDEEDESVINEPEESAPEWVVDKKNGKATYQADVSAGYVISGGKEISYSNAVDDKKIVEVTGLDKTKLAAIAEFNYDGDKATVSKEDFAKYMTVSGNTVTVNSDAFLSATTKLSDKSYTFAVGEDYEDENGYEVKVDIVKAGTETTDLQWVVSGTTAKLYNGGGAAGYEVNAKGELVYKAATVSDDKLLATITGLKKGISASDFTAENIEINSEAGLITLKGTTLLGTTTVAITSDNYNIGVSGVETSETKNAYWSASSGTATYKQKTTAGYTVVNGKSITYAAKDAIATLATIKGLSKDLTDNNIDQYVSTGSDGTITIKSDVALTTSNVTLTGTGYKLALAENVTQSKADATVTEFVTSKGTATYKTYDKSWYTKTNDTTITTTKETAGTTHATIKGLNTAITNAQANEYIHVEDGVITIDEGALVAEPTSKTIIQLTNGKNADNTVAKYTLALSKQNVVYNTPTFTANTKGTAALLVSTVETAGYDTSTDGLKLTYMPEKVNDKDNSVTLATVSNAKADGLEVDTETNVITVNEAALDKKKISLGKNDPYTFALGGYFGATISDEKWSTSGTTATLKGKTSDSYTLTDSKNIACTLGTEGTNKDTTLATIKGVGKGKEVAEADFDDENKVVTLTADLLTTAGASGKADSISTSVAVDSAYGYEFDFEAEFAGSESKASSITGGANSDNIKVEGSYLIINAKAGDDIIDLGTAGNNTFVYAVKDGNDVIADFTTGSDKIKINTKDAQVTLSNGDADAVLTITDKSGKNEGTITLTGMAGQIQKGDIINSTGADIDFATANLSELIAESNAGVYGNYNTNQDYTSLASQQQQTIAYSGDK
jgi:hypothetical protein